MDGPEGSGLLAYRRFRTPAPSIARISQEQRLAREGPVPRYPHPLKTVPPPEAGDPDELGNGVGDHEGRGKRLPEKPLLDKEAVMPKGVSGTNKHAAVGLKPGMPGGDNDDFLSPGPGRSRKKADHQHKTEDNADTFHCPLGWRRRRWIGDPDPEVRGGHPVAAELVAPVRWRRALRDAPREPPLRWGRITNPLQKASPKSRKSLEECRELARAASPAYSSPQAVTSKRKTRGLFADRA